MLELHSWNIFSIINFQGVIECLISCKAYQHMWNQGEKPYEKSLSKMQVISNPKYCIYSIFEVIQSLLFVCRSGKDVTFNGSKVQALCCTVTWQELSTFFIIRIFQPYERLQIF